MCVPLVRVGAAVTADVVMSTRLFAIRYKHYELGFHSPARNDHPVQAFDHGGHTAASV